MIEWAVIAVSLFVIWRAHRITSDTRRGWISRGTHDPEVVAAVMARVGWWERRRLAREMRMK